LRNGTSVRGKYAKPVRTAGGVEVSAGEIVKITGKVEGEIRQFMRGRLADSYMFLKHNAAVSQDGELVAKAQNAGLLREQVWLLADWLGDNCPYFVGDEADVYRRYRASTIALSNERRRQDPGVQDRVIESAPESREVRDRPQASGNYNTALY